ncbi:MAG: hypothetical protein K5622_03710 [Endomicrobiaceae bacterium]|nr:hypothetical protein [Endomicrobiaceae bacterium]
MGYKRSLYGKEKHNKNGWFCFYKNKKCLHFETQQKAEHALKFVNEYDNPDYVPKRVYLCRCGYWHLTSKTKKEFFAKEFAA